jgi:hypothetical protein
MTPAKKCHKPADPYAVHSFGLWNFRIEASARIDPPYRAVCALSTAPHFMV